MGNEPVVHVIDDDEGVRRSLTFLLQCSEIATRTYESAVQFLAAVPAMDHGCIITDVRMPGMSGIELLGEVRHRRWLERAPVAMLSQPVADKVVVTSYRLGACAFLSKPARAHELREAVRDFAQAPLRMSAATPVPGTPAMVRRSAAA